MKTLRYFFALLAIVALLFALPGVVQAQSEVTNIYTLSYQPGAPQAVFVAMLSTNIGTTIVTNTTLVQPALLHNNLSVQATLLGNGTPGTNIVTVTFQKSIDNVNWKTGNTMVLTGLGSLTASTISNWTVLADPYWRLFTVSSTVGTNGVFSIYAAGKDGY